MASLIRGRDKEGKPNKQWRVQFMKLDGSKSTDTLRFSNHTKKQAESVFTHIKGLIAAKRSNTKPDDISAAWIGGLPTPFFDKLVKVGLVAPKVEESPNEKPDEVFADFVEKYITARKDVKPGTRKTWGQALSKVRDFFGDRTIRSLTVKDGKDFLRWLKTPKEQGGAGHKGETPSKHLGHVRGFLKEAVDDELIVTNPFRAVKARRSPQKHRKQMIAVQDVLRVIEAAPDIEMKAIIALSFWGGLRTPSEHFILKWGAIRWDENMMTILSPKTEAVGKESRETPLFPELVPYLMDLQEVSHRTGPNDFVIQKRRTQADSNLRRLMTRLCTKAGVKPWPKIFQNLRSTRQTILEQFYPRGTVCEWMGNTEDVAEGHYIQEMKEFRAKAAAELTTDTRVTDKAHPITKTAGVSHWVSQNTSERSRNGGKSDDWQALNNRPAEADDRDLSNKKTGFGSHPEACLNGSGWESNPPGTG